MKSPEIIVGIDLGTTNCSISVTSLNADSFESVPIGQLIQAGVIGDESLLPSFLYLPHKDEFSESSLALPWRQGNCQDIIGQFAKNHGSLVPERLVNSAKSWLCNNQVDRKSAILPWQSSAVKKKVSPFECTKKFLEHLKGAFEHRHGNSSILDCRVVLTVPASFDEIARNLTFEAAQAAGLGDVVLLEEPLAALYAWLSGNTEQWRDQISPGDIILVCDVGGGTTDLSLVAVQEKSGELEPQRISVGEHILLGGDNMDLALAYSAKQQLEDSGPALDHWQFLGLIQSCRFAKESLFTNPSLDKVNASAPARGSNLFAHARSAEVTREMLENILLNGFLPQVGVDEMPKTSLGSGLQALGLPYSAEPAITKHIAAFLRSSLANVSSDPSLKESINPDAIRSTHIQPTSVLFNGGVFQADELRKRVCSVLNSWGVDEKVKELSGANLSHAVSHGAASFGRIREKGTGIKIHAGTTRSYYLGLESSMPAVPGITHAIKGICVVEQNSPEGSEASLPEKEFGLVTGSNVSFRFFSSSIRAGDRVGTIVEDAERSLEETSAVSMFIPPAEGGNVGDIIPVELHSTITELGVLELWMKHKNSSQRWKLEFNIRPNEGEAR